MPPKKNKQRRTGKKQSYCKQHNSGNNSSEPQENLQDLGLEALNSSPNFGFLLKIDEPLGADITKLYVTAGSLRDNFDDVLGSGDSGIVSLGSLRKSDGSWVKVAVKRAVDDNKTCFEEAKMMAQFNHENVIKILAVRKAPLRIAMEYMDWRDLQTALRSHHFTNMDLLNIFHDIACGMEHIAMKNYVHGDLWLKNVFVNSKKQCKVGDFEFCKYVGDTNGYVYLKGFPKLNHLYACCVAPDIEQYRLSTKTDVWTMGLLMWQAYTHAHNHTSSQLFKGLTQLRFLGVETLPKPLRCPPMVHKYICKKVLNADPEKRHTFTLLKTILAHFIYLSKVACLNDLD